MGRPREIGRSTPFAQPRAASRWLLRQLVCETRGFLPTELRQWQRATVRRKKSGATDLCRSRRLRACAHSCLTPPEQRLPAFAAAGFGVCALRRKVLAARLASTRLGRLVQPRPTVPPVTGGAAVIDQPAADAGSAVTLTTAPAQLRATRTAVKILAVVSAADLTAAPDAANRPAVRMYGRHLAPKCNKDSRLPTALERWTELAAELEKAAKQRQREAGEETLLILAVLPFGCAPADRTYRHSQRRRERDRCALRLQTGL